MSKDLHFQAVFCETKFWYNVRIVKNSQNYFEACTETHASVCIMSAYSPSFGKSPGI